jgi:hypothetical protein
MAGLAIEAGYGSAAIRLELQHPRCSFEAYDQFLATLPEPASDCMTLAGLGMPSILAPSADAGWQCH